jgi:hypothetical protein
MGVWLPCKHAGAKISIIGVLKGTINNMASIGCENLVREGVTTVFRDSYDVTKTFFGFRWERRLIDGFPEVKTQ